MESGYQKINPRKLAKNKRLIAESLQFLQNEEKTKNPEGTMKALFTLYQELDSGADYISPSERQFFPKNKEQRTFERFLEGFRYIYFILRRAQERLYLSNAFDNFWEQCKSYLKRCEYSEKFITTVLKKDSFFYRQSFNYWRSEFGDSEEGFSVMYKYFRGCFGIVGNDEYCSINKGREVSYDWKRMKNCFERFNEKPKFSNPVLRPSDYVPLSDEKLQMLKTRIKGFKFREQENNIKADALLLEIQKRNKEKGYFHQI